MLIIEYGSVKTENANRPRGFGALTLENFSPYPKNPVIGAFFREIHRADELGSGMCKLMRYGKTYGGADPELIEGDIFRMVIRVPEFGTVAPNGEQANGDVPSASKVGTKLEPSQGLSRGQVGAKLEPSLSQAGTKLALSRHQVEILKSCAQEKSITELMQIAGRSDRTKFRNQVLNPLLAAGLLEMMIPDKPTSSKQKYRLTEAGASAIGKASGK
jgi:ATP-dependent DNA helicase RecG